MKYKVVANGVSMIEDCTALKALQMVCGVMQGLTPQDAMHVQVMYRSDNAPNEWRFETGFKKSVPTDSPKVMDDRTKKLLRATAVILKTPHILKYLCDYDPKAYMQAREAFYEFSIEELSEIMPRTVAAASPAFTPASTNSTPEGKENSK